MAAPRTRKVTLWHQNVFFTIGFPRHVQPGTPGVHKLLIYCISDKMTLVRWDAMRGSDLARLAKGSVPERGRWIIFHKIHGGLSDQIRKR